MSLFERLFGKRRAEAEAASTLPSQLHLNSVHAPTATATATSQATTRRELLRVVLRDTLQRHGIPPGWISAETLIATSRQRPSGIHWRLSVHHWDPRLLTHGVALQHSLIRHLMGFDPMAAEWLMGISWQFALHDESQCPPMPHPGLWTNDPRPEAPERTPSRAAGTGVTPKPSTSPIDDESSLDNAEEDLKKLFAIRDADLKHHGGGGSAPGAVPSRPEFPPTEQAGL